jgi:hypothetical protein
MAGRRAKERERGIHERTYTIYTNGEEEKKGRYEISIYQRLLCVENNEQFSGDGGHPALLPRVLRDRRRYSRRAVKTVSARETVRGNERAQDDDILIVQTRLMAV